MRVVILAPRRSDGGGERDVLWAFCKRWWQEHTAPEWEIFEGEDEGPAPFNRSRALNRAAEAAGEWDVAVLIDCDVIANAAAVHTGVELACSTGQLVINHDERLMLSRQMSQQILGGFRDSWRPGVERTWYDSVSCSVSVSRELWDRVGGFDELFSGWGREDTAFRIACETLTGKHMLRVSSEVFHLWHTDQPGVNPSSATRKANEERNKRYHAAFWNVDALQPLLDEAKSARLHLEPTRIPRILHRTVPAETTEEVEGWWRGWRALLPGWDLRTYREPLAESEWPLTSSAWGKCQNGAQKAGLIRLEALVCDGGVYVDSDVRPMRSLEPLLDVHAFAAWEDETTVPDAVLACEKGHPAFAQMLELAVASVLRGEDAWLSGPGVSTKVLPSRNDVLLLPPGSFYPHHYLQKSEAGKKDGPWVFGEHMWHHSWGTPAQRKSIESRQRK